LEILVAFLDSKSFVNPVLSVLVAGLSPHGENLKRGCIGNGYIQKLRSIMVRMKTSKPIIIIYV
jgi:hypothetical protein